MPNVAEIIKDQVTLEVRCLDRLYLNAYVLRLQSSGGVIDFLVRACRQKIASPAVFGQITTAFKTGLRAWADDHRIPWIEFRKSERKDAVVQRYRDRFTKSNGVVVIGVAQERASTWTATKKRMRFVDFLFYRKPVCVAHYYIYLIDPEWGPEVQILANNAFEKLPFDGLPVQSFATLFTELATRCEVTCRLRESSTAAPIRQRRRHLYKLVRSRCCSVCSTRNGKWP